MSKVIYNKRRTFKLFNMKIFELLTEYSERATEKDDPENDFYIDLKERENRRIE